LNGNFDLAAYAAPRHYNVMQENDRYEVQDLDNPGPVRIMNREQYETWYATLRDQDCVFTVVWENYKGTAQEVQDSIKQAAPLPTPAEKPRARKTPVNTVKNDSHLMSEENKVPIIPNENNGTIEVQNETFALPTSGRISEYGTTWKLSSN
jgi:hypothetical protein